jgi:Tol biopolymer transport system component/DNA-binding winged helix-turn-helix (wHTH) protein
MATPGGNVIYEFGSFRLDPVERTLTSGGAQVALAPKVIDTLLVLVERAGHVVTKEELIASIWPDTFVDDSNVAQNIFRLRKALGDESESFIETMARRGYRFVAEVRAVAATSVKPVEVIRGKKRRFVAPAAAAAVIALLVALLNLTSGGTSGAGIPPASPRGVTLEKLTVDSRSWDPAISADGKLVAYVVLEGEAKSIWLKNISTGSAVQVMPSSSHDYRGLRFSPDGNELFYETHRDGEAEAMIVRIPVFGGAPIDVARNVWSDFAVSPEGLRVAFVRGSNEPNVQMHLIVAKADGSSERIVARSTPGRTRFALWDSAPSWSPDGRSIALCGDILDDSSGNRASILDVRLSDGSITAMATPAWSSIDQAAWLEDGSALAVVAREGSAKPSQVWLLDKASGKARRVTNDLADYGKIGVSADSRILVLEQRTSSNHIWTVPEGDSSQVRQLTFGAADSDGYYGLSWTSDGRILFSSNRSGEYEIWSMNPDGSGLRQITVGSAGWNYWPTSTNDGRFIVFGSNRVGRSHIFRMDADGTNTIQLTRGHSQVQPGVSPDGLWVYYADIDVAPARLERVSTNGGQPAEVPNTIGSLSPAISPDGRTIAYNHFDATDWHNALLPFGGTSAQVFPWNGERGIVHWTPDSKALVYANHGTVNNLWQQPVTGGAPRPRTNFKDEHIWNFAISPDGHTFALCRGRGGSEVILARNFR